jgi:hypothetical protein
MPGKNLNGKRSIEGFGITKSYWRIKPSNPGSLEPSNPFYPLNGRRTKIKYCIRTTKDDLDKCKSKTLNED